MDVNRLADLLECCTHGRSAGDFRIARHSLEVNKGCARPSVFELCFSNDLIVSVV